MRMNLRADGTMNPRFRGLRRLVAALYGRPLGGEDTTDRQHCLGREGYARYIRLKGILHVYMT